MGSRANITTGSHKTVFTQTGKTITASPANGGLSESTSFDVTGMKTADVAKAFKLLGLKVVKG